ncbi:helix-turn-helix transcriptional regulator [Bradyrhizobium sp. RT9a]|uniref:helix-turn-helix domain-containing protein n=1 Tax=Bradyrhizobium sp. RT9a TaxID=3156384 RepID=UPI00339A6A67
MKPKSAFATIDKYIGARIRTRRMQLGLSQTDLGDALGVSFQQVQKYEKGHNRVSTATLLTIAGIMEVEAAHFYQGAPGTAGKRLPQAISEVDQFMATKDGVIIAQSLVAIADPDVRHAVAKSIQRISSALAPKPHTLMAAE